MIYNYHTHTTRCRHAYDTDEDYIKFAIDGGVKYMGFSDHAPYIFPDGFESTHRVEVSKIDDYFSSLRALRNKYRDKIDIKIGFEMEYYPAYFPAMYDLAVESGAEYLILGQHYIFNEHPNGVPSSAKTENVDYLREYVNCVIGGMKTGAFSYVCHPDMMKFVGDDEIYYKEMKKICVVSKEYEIPLEINFMGIRNDRFYPYDRFWQIAGEVGCPVTFGMDAHEKEAACDKKSVLRATELVKKYGLKYIGMPKIVPLSL
jgi:histidinol-phosphatase (PHP family)